MTIENKPKDQQSQNNYLSILAIISIPTIIFICLISFIIWLVYRFRLNQTTSKECIIKSKTKTKSTSKELDHDSIQKEGYKYWENMDDLPPDSLSSSTPIIENVSCDSIDSDFWKKTESEKTPSREDSNSPKSKDFLLSNLLKDLTPPKSPSLDYGSSEEDSHLF